MAKYELGAIYKINGRSGELYYVRLLTNDCYGVFSSLEGELNEETFAQTHYRLYFSCNSFPIKRGIWEKVVSSPNCTDIARLFVLVARPFDVVAVDILKMLHVGGYPVFVLFVYLVHMETDAVVRELYAHAVKCGIFTAYHVVAVFRLGYVLPYLLHEWRQFFFCLFHLLGKHSFYV